MQGLSLGWGPGASLVLGLPKALPRHRARTPSQEGAGQARGAGPQQLWASCGPRRMASPQHLGASPQHVITEGVAWDSWPSAVIRRGAPGAPGRPEHRRPPEPGARPPALCLPTSLPPAPSSATSCPVSCLWPQDAPLPNSSFPGALWQVHEAGRACLLCRGTMWLGTWATGRREKASGGSGPRAWVLLDPDGFLAGPAQGLPAGEGHAQTVPSWPVLLPPGPSLHTWPWTCRARAHLHLPVLCTRNGLSHLHLASFSSPSRASPSGEQHRTPPCTPALRSKALPLPARTGPLGATRHGLQPSGDSDAPQDLAPHLAQRPQGTACLLPQL